jgi:NTP pyrophosphatase (non-canonical NTP hydrolase)
MDLRRYQLQSARTDQNPKRLQSNRDKRTPARHEVIPILGLVGEVGGLASEYKKLLRDGATHRKFKDEIQEELGDILWYVANAATKFGLNLDSVARQNIAKTTSRYLHSRRNAPLLDARFPAEQQLPRRFAYRFEHRRISGVKRLQMIDIESNEIIGDSLTDNTYEDSGYRYHDVMHLTFAARLGWSPVYRKLLRKKKKVIGRRGRKFADVEDGGRAQVIEEAIVVAAYAYASEHDLLDGVDAVDWHLLRFIIQLTQGLEASVYSAKDWNDALLHGFKLWRHLRDHRGGIVRGNLAKRSIEIT